MGWEDIDDDDRSDLATVLEKLLAFVDGRTVLVWNAHFEQQFFGRAGVKFGHLVDSMPVAMPVSYTHLTLPTICSV